MAFQTNSQKMAQAAFSAVNQRVTTEQSDSEDGYGSFARSFPSLVHACGLAQAIAFAQAKDQCQYLDDLVSVLNAANHTDATNPENLGEAARESAITAYIRLSRNTLQAAGWIKRYVEAINSPSNAAPAQPTQE